MGVDAGVTVYFYKGDTLIKTSYIDCYKFQSNSQVFDVTKYDSIKIHFSTEYDASSETESEEGEEDITDY